MAAINQEPLNEENVRALFRILSPERMGTYVVASGHNENRAIQLYLWNAQLGEAFHVAIQGVEVGLRNCVNAALTTQYGERWWEHSEYDAIVDHDRKVDIETVLRRIRNRKLSLVNGQVVAGLSFGFWVGMLQARYNPNLWSRHLRTAFPNFPPDRNRKSLAHTAGNIATLRNRISHHEPLLKRNHMADYRLVMEALGWLCPIKQDLIRTHCRVPEIVRGKP